MSQNVLNYRDDPDFKELSGILPPDTSINASGSGLTRIADNTHVFGNVNARASQELQSIGSNVIVDGNLNVLHSRNLAQLGENITIGGELNIYGTKISVLPASLRMLNPEAFIYTNWGQFRAVYNLTAVEIANASAQKASAGGIAASTDTDNESSSSSVRTLQMAEFSNDLALTQLPEGFSAGFNIKARNSGLTGIKPETVIEGTLDVTGAKNFRSVGDGTKIGGSLRAAGSSDLSIGDNVAIGGGVLLNNSKNIRFGENVHIREDLHIVDSEIRSLPASMRVDGRIFSDFGIIESNGILSTVEIANMVFEKARLAPKNAPTPSPTAEATSSQVPHLGG